MMPFLQSPECCTNITIEMVGSIGRDVDGSWRTFPSFTLPVRQEERRIAERDSTAHVNKKIRPPTQDKLKPESIS